MAVTEQSFTGNGSTTNYSFTFPYLKTTDISVQVDAATVTNWSLANATTVQFNSAPSNGAKIKILRNTNVDNLTATFYAGSAIKSEDLNDNYTQNLYKTQEVGNRYFANTGGTMTGDLTLDTGADLIFEGSTEDTAETRLTVADPSTDRTITLPNETGTVVTTGSSGVVTSAMINDGTIATGDIANDAITNAKIADDSIDSEHYVDGSIDTAHIADAQVTAAKLATDSVTSAKIAAAQVDTSELATNAVTTVKITDANVTAAKLASDSVTTAKIVDANVTRAKLAADAVDGTKLADDAVAAEHIASNAVVSDSIADGSVVNGDINASAAIAHTKLAAIPDGQVLVGSGSTVPTAVAISGDVTLANDGAVTIASNAVEIGMIGCEQTTISDSDSHIPTSGAVVDYVAAQLLPFGGFEAIADEDNFPTTVPAAGVVISIKDATGVTVDGSGTSTTARTAGNGSDNVTINGFPSSMNSAAVPASTGLLVTSTGSNHTYNFHRLLPTTDDVRQLSDDVNDFFSRYRIASSEPGSNNDEGDLLFDTTANKMKVYDGSSWGEVTSTGEFKYLFLCPAGGTGAPTLDGSIATYDLREGSNSGSAASVTNAAQLIVSVNGVVQKANTGTSAPAEGFALVDGNTIIFGSNLASGDSVFIVQIGSAVSIPTPGDNTVTSAKIVDGTIVNADINASAAIAGSKLADNSISEAKLAIHAAPTGTDKFLKYTSNGMEWVVPSYTTNTTVGGSTGADFNDNVKARFGTGNDLEIFHDGSHSYIHATGTGNFQLKGDSVYIRTNDTEEAINCNANGSVELFYDATKELETKSGGVKLLGHSESIITALTSAASVTIDFSLSNHFSCTMGHNITFNNPTTESVGQSGTIVLTQDGTGSRTASWGSQFLWPGGTAPTLSTAANAVDRIDYFVAAADKIHCVASLAMA